MPGHTGMPPIIAYNTPVLNNNPNTRINIDATLYRLQHILNNNNTNTGLMLKLTKLMYINILLKQLTRP